MGKARIIAIMVLLGCGMLPGVASACHMHSSGAASCCRQAAVAETAAARPDRKAVSRTVGLNKDGAGGGSQTSCSCGTGSVFVALSTVIGSGNRMMSAAKRQGIPFDALPITGFSSIWLPPKLN